nr:hypothetical protein [Tanacetum cinerariifolium]
DMTITRSGMTPEAIEELIAQNGNRNHRDGGNNRNGNPNENVRGAMLVARMCTYQDFVKCQPLNFKGTEGVVGLKRWFEKMETVFHISNCPEVYQVKYVTCTLLDSALTWWKTYKKTVGVDAAFAMTWRDCMKLMMEVYCPRNEIQKTEIELWNLTARAFKEGLPKTEESEPWKQTYYSKARGKAYAIGGGDANPGSNVVTGKFLFNNHYASVLFDSGADRSFVLTTFSTLLDVIPNTLDVSYAVELADERITETNIVLRGCTIGLLGYPFNIDLMPVELSSFDECTKTQKYMKKGCQVFLAQVTKKETEVKSKEKQLEDVPIIQKFPEVFPEDLPGLPPARQFEFQIDLVPSAAPVARAPYRLAPSKMQELCVQLQELSDK